MGNFLAFRNMISGVLIKVSYLLGAIVLTGYGLMLTAAPFISNDSNRGLMFLVGIGLVTVGNVVWRLLCESIIVVFSIHELLESIDKKTVAK